MQERARRIARNFKPINYEEALPINAYINALDMTALYIIQRIAVA